MRSIVVSLAVVVSMSACREVAPPHLTGVPSASAATSARTLDQEFLDIDGIAPGFGGAFYTPHGILVIAIAKGGDHAAVGQALRVWAADRGRIRLSRQLDDQDFAIREVDFSFGQLSAWADLLLDHIRPDMRWYDIDEGNNRILLGTSDSVARVRVQVTAQSLGIPDHALDVQVGGAFLRTTDLSDRLRPAPGGVRIERAAKKGCTLGVNTTSSELGAGFFTASHCSSSIYAYDGSAMYQNVTDGSNLIASEFVDPVPFSCAHSGGCRQGDVAWYAYTGESLSDFGKIAKTTGFGSTTISSGSPRFSIDGVGSYFQGDTVYVMGQRSGWLEGTVLNTCFYFVDASGVQLNCQVVASFIVQGGDSGGPVFTL
ncbi:MAG: hypothetical protein WD043_09325 [Gemmatimonadales bacterium]